MIEVDLHLHTTFSDGNLSPTELVRLCTNRGLNAIAITDHDSTDGLPEALAIADELTGITIIPGIELSTDVPGAEIHLLGYFVDHMDPLLQNTLMRLRDSRQKRAQDMVKKLNVMGISISWERVQEISGDGAIGRPHIAQAMVEKGYVKYPRDAFTEYLGRNGSAYVEREKISPASATEMVVQFGALPVMAHPTYFMGGTDADAIAKLKRTLFELKEAGLVGMEVYYGDYSIEKIELLAAIANELSLIPCGGSDYHASGNPNEPEPGSVGPPIETLRALESLRQTRSTTVG